MNICCQTLTRAQRTQGIECFNLIQQPLFKLQFHPHTIWPKNDFCELPSKTPHDQYHCSDTVHLHTLFHIVRDKRWLAPSYHDPHPDHYHDPHINHHDDHHHDGDIFLPYCRGRGVSGSISHICRHIAIAPRHALWLDVFIIIWADSKSLAGSRWNTTTTWAEPRMKTIFMSSKQTIWLRWSRKRQKVKCIADGQT